MQVQHEKRIAKATKTNVINSYLKTAVIGTNIKRFTGNKHTVRGWVTAVEASTKTLKTAYQICGYASLVWAHRFKESNTSSYTLFRLKLVSHSCMALYIISIQRNFNVNNKWRKNIKKTNTPYYVTVEGFRACLLAFLCAITLIISVKKGRCIQNQGKTNIFNKQLDRSKKITTLYHQHIMQNATRMKSTS